MSERNFFAELKRRNVYKVAVAYTVVGWLLVQVATQVFPFFEIPNWAVRLIVLAIVIGFPIALVIAWAFELTPEGLKRTEDVDLTSQAGKKSHAWIYVVIVGALLSVGLFILGRYGFREKVSASNELSAKSIAVLPFVNMSSDKEQEYFSDGLSEELLNQLAQIPQLRVIARTSSFSFKGKEVDVATIAKALNVANVLEGSVRKSANTLRITAQLVRASDSSHLWSKTYDRDLTDVFKVQDEIAGDVVAALKVKLLPRQLPKTQRTGNPEAYEHYLLGMEISRRDRMEASQLAAVEFQKAITLDPGYANAYVMLAIAQVRSSDLAPSQEQRAEEIRQSLVTIDQAIALAPDLAFGYSNRGYLRQTRAWDWKGADADFKRALALEPNNAELLSFYSRSLFFNGHQEEAIALARKATVIDPLSLEIWHNLGMLLSCSTQDAEARLAWQHALEITPGARWPNYMMGYLDLKEGKSESALAHFRASDEPFRLTGTAMVEHTLGHAQESEQALDALAVLPFDNLSRDPDNAFFAEGVQDEILTRLAKVADLKVIARTSTQRFKSAPTDLSDIAKQLGVANILEGSVQKSNDQVRVNVQLINALTNAHLWAEIYDRKLSDIFAVQSDIAKAVADTLQAKLTGSEKQMMAAQETTDTTAYELYHKGRSFWEKRSGDNIPKAIALYEQAIARDPNYALAYAGLASAQILTPFYTGAARREAPSKAKEAALKALRLDPNLAEAHLALGKVLFFGEIDLAGATREYQRAVELKPNDAMARHWLGNDALAALGRFEEAIAECKRAVELDPLSPIINADLGTTFSYANRYDEAAAQLRKTLEIDPTFFYTRYNLGIVLQVTGDLSGAIVEYEKARQLSDNTLVSTLSAQAKAYAGDKDAARRMLSDLDKISQQREVVGYWRALLYLSLNNKDEALRWLEQGFAERDGFNISWIKVDPLLNSLHGDPRFEALAEKIAPAREFAKSATPSR